MKRLIVAGSRHCTWAAHASIIRGAIRAFITFYWRPDIIVSGGAKGADEIGERLAAQAGIPVERYGADWSRGPKAGPERNARMIAVSDGLVVCRFADSCGSADVHARAEKKGIPVVDCLLEVA